MQVSLFKPRAEKLTLRPYQRESIDAVYHHLRTRDDNPVVVIPTGGGKTPVIATICQDAVKQWGGRVLVLAHVKELLQQAADKLHRVCPDVPVGVYSAGLGRRECNRPVTVGGIQSIYKRACDLDPFDLVIVDEAHLIPPEGEGMYRQFLADAKTVNPHLRIIGLTATPFRMKSGPICTEDGFLNSICYEVGVRQLIVEGYLSPLKTKAGTVKADTSGLHVRGGEFIAAEVEALMDENGLVRAACQEIVEHTASRQACLIFAAGVEHAKHIVATLEAEHGLDCGFVCGDTPSTERDRTLGRFLDGELKYLANVNVLTTGFDAPHIDCVALVRPTLSAGLYYQMVGRGFRLHEGKQDCLVLDFGGNVLRHGPVDQLKVQERSGGGEGDAPAKECPECQAVIAAGYSVCPDCGYEFPPPERKKHEAKASDAGILSGEVTLSTYSVKDIYYSVHIKRDADDDAPKTMRVDYQTFLGECHSEWICIEHTGWARKKAEAWWEARSDDPMPSSAERAVDIACGGGLASCGEITVRSVAGERFDRITDYVLGPKPEPAPIDKEWLEDDEIPF